LGSPSCAWLEGHHYLLVVDLSGHADSDASPDDDHKPLGYAAALGKFLDQLGIDAAHVAGDSVGEWTALELAKLDRARSVVGIAPAGLWPRRDPWRCSLKLWAMCRLGRLMRPLTERALRSEQGAYGSFAVLSRSRSTCRRRRPAT
jgi:pimeloyl-ACP methyl ester carboxylesterase